MNIPQIRVEQAPGSGLWQWKIIDFVQDRVIGQSAYEFHDEMECIADLKLFGRFVSAFATAKELQLMHVEP